MNSRSACSNSLRDGFTMNLPSTRATRTSEIISLIGISETAKAADAAKQAIASGITCSSLEIRVINTCTSHK